MEFETRRIKAFKFIPEYLDIMYSTWGTNKDVARYIPGFRIDWDINDFSEYVLKTYQDPNHTRILIQDKNSNQIIGNISLYQEDSRSKSVNIWLIPDVWNKGFATEALKGVIKILKKEHIGSIYATCDKRNIGCVHMLEKCDFELIDTIPDARCDIDGVVGDELLYELEVNK